MISRILGKNAMTLSDPTNFEVDEDGQYIHMNVMMDEVLYIKWLKDFEPE